MNAFEGLPPEEQYEYGLEELPLESLRIFREMITQRAAGLGVELQISGLPSESKEAGISEEMDFELRIKAERHDAVGLELKAIADELNSLIATKELEEQS